MVRAMHFKLFKHPKGLFWQGKYKPPANHSNNQTTKKQNSSKVTAVLDFWFDF